MVNVTVTSGSTQHGQCSTKHMLHVFYNALVIYLED